MKVKANYKVGDKVILKSNLKKGRYYGYEQATAKVALLSKSGEVVEIRNKWGDCFQVKGSYAVLSIHMIEREVSKYSVNLF